MFFCKMFGTEKNQCFLLAKPLPHLVTLSDRIPQFEIMRRGPSWACSSRAHPSTHFLAKRLAALPKPSPFHPGSFTVVAEEELKHLLPRTTPWIGPLTETEAMAGCLHTPSPSAGDAECDQTQVGSREARLQTAWEEITFGFGNISFNLKRSRRLPFSSLWSSSLCTEPVSCWNTSLNHCVPLNIPTCDLTSSTCKNTVQSTFLLLLVTEEGFKEQGTNHTN